MGARRCYARAHRAPRGERARAMKSKSILSPEYTEYTGPRGHRVAMVVATVHGILIVLAALAYFVGAYRPMGMASEFYGPYLYISGPAVWLLAYWLCKIVPAHYFPSLYECGELVVIVLPGLVCIVVGGLQYYLVTRGIVWLVALGGFEGQKPTAPK